MPHNLPFPRTAKPFPNNARATHELFQYVPQMSTAERDRRWDKLRKKMLMTNLDALILLGNDIYWSIGMANLRYLFQVDAEGSRRRRFALVSQRYNQANAENYTRTSTSVGTAVKSEQGQRREPAGDSRAHSGQRR